MDVEDWYQGHDLNIDPVYWNRMESRVEYSTNAILEIASRYNARGTFFVLGYTAQKHPALIKRIINAGHEIGSHGYWHKMVKMQKKEVFRSDLLNSKYILEDIIGKEVKLYRAPSWSISRNSLWALQVLEEEGFICDSSIHPCKTPLYGIHCAPIVPYHPVIEGKRLNLLEFPPTMITWGRFRLPFAGGFYLRILPKWLLTCLLVRVNEKRQGMVYIHPWELDIEQPKLKVSMTLRLVHYLNIGTTKEKLEALFRNFCFVPLGEVIVNEDYPSLPVFNN